MEEMLKRAKGDFLGCFVRLGVLVWSGGLLTASYLGLVDKMDPTYVASILSGTLTTFHITREKKE